MNLLRKIENSIKFSIKEYEDRVLRSCVQNKNLIADVIEEKIRNEKQYQFYIDFILGYTRRKPNARKEDLQYAVDLALFYRQVGIPFSLTKSFLKNKKPIELGEFYKTIEIYHQGYHQTKTKNYIEKAKQKGELIPGVEPIILHKDEVYKIYLVPRLNKKEFKNNCTINEKRIQENKKNVQHLLYCHLGKGTEWCTANPTGDYYHNYFFDDIYVVHKNNKPFIQFNVVGSKSRIAQMMDVHDVSVEVLDKQLADIIEKATDLNIEKYRIKKVYRNVLDDLSDDDKIKVFPKRFKSYNAWQDIIDYYGLQGCHLLNESISNSCKNSPEKSYNYARIFIGNFLRKNESESNENIDKFESQHPIIFETISKSAEYSYRYASNFSKRFKLGEPAISQSAKYSYLYSIDCSDDPAFSVSGSTARFELGEPAISKDAAYSYEYAQLVLKDRFLLGEPAVLSNLTVALDY